MISNYIKKVFYEDDRFKITLEEVDGYLMVHLAVYEFSKSILKEIKVLWKDIRDRSYMSGYDKIYTYTREPRMFKFFPEAEKLGEFEKSGLTYEVWVWELK